MYLSIKYLLIAKENEEPIRYQFNKLIKVIIISVRKNKNYMLPNQMQRECKMASVIFVSKMNNLYR